MVYRELIGNFNNSPAETIRPNPGVLLIESISDLEASEEISGAQIQRSAFLRSLHHDASQASESFAETAGAAPGAAAITKFDGYSAVQITIFPPSYYFP